MKQIQILFLEFVMVMICFGCGEDSESKSIDDVVGYYCGDWTRDSTTFISGCCKVEKVSDHIVNLQLRVGGWSIFSYPCHVELSDQGDGKIKLYKYDISDTLTGIVYDNFMILTLENGAATFSGRKNDDYRFPGMW